MKPMLASSDLPDITKIKYPKYASTKIDGIRCLIMNGVAVSRSLKPIPNLFIQNYLSKYELDNCDGELIVEGDFNDVQSAVMSIHGTPDFKYLVFDYVHDSATFDERLSQAIHKVYNAKSERIEVLPQWTVSSSSTVEEIFKSAIAKGQEGLILKDPEGKYKYGRSTLKQELMLKLKEVHDIEVEVIGFEELMSNQNEQEIDNLGNKVRSSVQANMVPMGTLGSLRCKYYSDKLKGFVTFNAGSGLDDHMRYLIWSNRDRYIGKFATIKHLGISKYGVPRCPIFKGFRSNLDMSDG